ncbi:MAG: alkaline phosphatase family protein [Candidatus Hydrogenedentes bacterium]|nr:alkaline phosphatase family protein [Candidatus Hydrogenedentota bacterium]
MGKGRVQRVLVIGLDCAAPQFIFGADRFDLPHMQALAANGCWGLLRSCDPPITVPAWATMMSSKDPGTLGCYGFRNRADYSYREMVTADASIIREPRVWDVLSRHGLKSVVLGVPQTSPPKPLNGWLVSGPETPQSGADYTYPKTLRRELESNFGECLFDVEGFRTDQKSDLLTRIYALMENRFAVARHLMKTKPWDFFMMVEMGMDRLHHGFWRYCDPTHPAYTPGNPFEQVFRKYYRAIDERIGELISLAGKDTAVMIVSDHGARPMLGGFCINQWLAESGYLCVNAMPSAPTRFEECAIDWDKTTAWSAGGYYARVFLNLAGREPQGVVPPEDYERVRDELAVRLESLTGPDGKPMGNRVLKPEQVYRTVNGIAPDLLVYAGDLSLRAIGTLGHRGLFTQENDTGPDDANHDIHGVFILDERRGASAGPLVEVKILDVAPTLLDLLGIEAPGDFQGSALRDRF